MLAKLEATQQPSIRAAEIVAIVRGSDKACALNAIGVKTIQCTSFADLDAIRDIASSFDSEMMFMEFESTMRAVID